MPKNAPKNKLISLIAVAIFSILLLSLSLWYFYPKYFQNHNSTLAKISSSSSSQKDNFSHQNNSSLSKSQQQVLESELKNEQAKQVKNFQNWEQIKFEGKVNKIADIPQELIIKHGIPRFGFRFYKGVAFWNGPLNNSVEGKAYENKFLAYDGEKVVEILDQEGRTIGSPKSSEELSLYFLSSLIKNGVGYGFSCAGGGWGCIRIPGFFIDFEKGQYWLSKNGLDEQGRPVVETEAWQNYYQASLDPWLPHTRKGIFNYEGFRYYKDGKLYGLFLRQEKSPTERASKENLSNLMVMVSDGQTASFLYEGRNNCQSRVVLCSGEMAFNSRNNLVYYGLALQPEDFHDFNNKRLLKLKITEQDFKTGQILQEEEFLLPQQEVFAKYGIEEIKDEYKL